MKNVVLASVLASVTTAFAVPSIAGPVHFALTRPHSIFGWVPSLPNGGGTATLTLGTVPLDFILTDVMLGTYYERVLITVNAVPVMNVGVTGNLADSSAHLQSGVFIPAGSIIRVEATYAGDRATAPITLTGYVQ